MLRLGLLSQQKVPTLIMRAVVLAGLTLCSEALCASGLDGVRENLRQDRSDCIGNADKQRARELEALQENVPLTSREMEAQDERRRDIDERWSKNCGVCNEVYNQGSKQVTDQQAKTVDLRTFFQRAESFMEKATDLLNAGKTSVVSPNRTNNFSEGSGVVSLNITNNFSEKGAPSGGEPRSPHHVDQNLDYMGRGDSPRSGGRSGGGFGNSPFAGPSAFSQPAPLGQGGLTQISGPEPFVEAFCEIKVRMDAFLDGYLHKVEGSTGKWLFFFKK